jgi:tRNA threonylcarbamoyl adenosine modification protein (Sua5/YciO/YrdC/YwlC family)
VSSSVDEAVQAIRSGRPVILPTDTVYGLCANPYGRDAASRLYRLKGREGTHPTALLAHDVDMLLECVPELRGRAATIVRALLPGPFTLVLPNPAGRFPWLTGARPDTIGVRVAELPGEAARVLERVGAVAATSANLPGGRDPSTLEEVPAEIRDSVAAELDGGKRAGVPSTVLDLTGPEPQVVREGAVPAREALERLAAVAVY